MPWKRDSTQLVSGGNDGRAIVGGRHRAAHSHAAAGGAGGPRVRGGLGRRRRALRWRPPTACTSTMRRPASAARAPGEKAYGVALSPDGMLLAAGFERGAVTLSPVLPVGGTPPSGGRRRGRH